MGEKPMMILLCPVWMLFNIWGTNREKNSMMLPCPVHMLLWPQEKGNCPMHVAAQAGQTAQVELLAVYGADPGARDANGRTPIEYAKWVVSQWWISEEWNSWGVRSSEWEHSFSKAKAELDQTWSPFRWVTVNMQGVAGAGDKRGLMSQILWRLKSPSGETGSQGPSGV